MTGALAPKLETVARRGEGEPARRSKRAAPSLSHAIQTELFATRPEGNVVSIAADKARGRHANRSGESVVAKEQESAGGPGHARLSAAFAG